MTFFITAPLDARDEQNKEFFKNPRKVGCPNLFHKVSIDYEAMVELDYWDPDWSDIDNIVAFKEAKAKKAAEKHVVEESSSSFAQRMKARWARTSSTPLGGVIDLVNLDDSDDSSQGDMAVEEEEDKEAPESMPKPPRPPTDARQEGKEKEPKKSDLVPGTKRGVGTPLGGPRLKKPQFRQAPAPR